MPTLPLDRATLYFLELMNKAGLTESAMMKSSGIKISTSSAVAWLVVLVIVSGWGGETLVYVFCTECGPWCVPSCGCAASTCGPGAKAWLGPHQGKQHRAGWERDWPGCAGLLSRCYPCWQCKKRTVVLDGSLMSVFLLEITRSSRVTTGLGTLEHYNHVHRQ